MEHPMSGPIVSGSGIRGVFGASLTATDAVEYAAAFGRLVGPGRVVLGRDTRKSGPAMESAVAAGLMSVGCTPVKLGVVPTPTVQLESMADGVAGGIAVTSSHNPGEWNALKLIGPDGVFLREGDRRALSELLRAGPRWEGASGAAAGESLAGAVERHVRAILALPLVRRPRRSMRVVLDVTGGAAAEFGPALMEALGVGFSVINPRIRPDGSFPRVAEPTVASLQGLAAEVRRSGADAGFGFDPDGDRLALVDGDGRVMGEDLTVALAIDWVLGERPGCAVVNLSTSRLAEDAAARHGAEVFRSPVGEVNVVEEMERRGAVIGGEGNGGVIDPSFHLGRDSGVAMAYTLSLLDARRTSLSEWARSFPGYSMVKDKVPFEGDFSDIRDALLRKLGEPDDDRDGLWYRRGRGWTHVRPSGTEPVIRVICEDESDETVRQELQRFRKVVSG
jgi:phosphomannomutase